MISITANNFDEWRLGARGLLAESIPPEHVHWQSSQQDGLFQQNDLANSVPKSGEAHFSVPPQFLSQAKQAACFIDAAKPNQKWAVLYSLLWRLIKVDRRSLSIKSDLEVQALQRMCSAVSRDKHKMKAFVRFQKTASVNKASHASQHLSERTEYFTSWFEPEHAIVESIAPFFVKRFNGMSWSILTPHGCAHWNQSELKLSDGVVRPKLEQDEFDDFWRVYYKSIFNPARLKEQAMRNEMPKKYWKYLPEASCIKDLTRDAAAAMSSMVEADTTNSDRVRSKSKSLTKVQDQLRAENRS